MASGGEVAEQKKCRDPAFVRRGLVRVLDHIYRTRDPEKFIQRQLPAIEKLLGRMKRVEK